MPVDNYLFSVVDDSVDAQGSQTLRLTVAATCRHNSAAGQQRQLGAHVARGASCRCHQHRLPLVQRPSCCLQVILFWVNSPWEGCTDHQMYCCKTGRAKPG